MNWLDYVEQEEEIRFKVAVRVYLYYTRIIIFGIVAFGTGLVIGWYGSELIW